MNTYTPNDPYPNGPADLDPRQRSLPTGYGVELSVWWVPRPLRSYYQCVTIPDTLRSPVARHAAAMNAAMKWAEQDLDSRGGHVPE